MNGPRKETFGNKKELVRAYQEQVLVQRDTREHKRDLLRKPALLFLRSCKASEALSSIAVEIIEQNVFHDLSWEPRKATSVCRSLEDMVLQLADFPWRKEFRTLKVCLKGRSYV
jgi:hypothetical protein